MLAIDGLFDIIEVPLFAVLAVVLFQHGWTAWGVVMVVATIFNLIELVSKFAR